MRIPPHRLLSVGLVALLVAAGLSSARSASAAGNAQSISFDAPSTVMAGGATIDLLGAASNSASSAIDAAYQVEVSGRAGLEPDQVHVAYESPSGSGNFVPVTLDGSGATFLVGTTASRSLPAETTIPLHFTLSVDADAPAGPVLVYLSLLETAPASTTVAYNSRRINITSPLAIAAPWPVAVEADNKPVDLTATLRNNSAVTVSGLRFDVLFPAVPGFASADLALSYESPAGSGNFVPVALGGDSSATGVIGAPSGFSLAPGATASVALRLTYRGGFPGNLYRGDATLWADQVSPTAPNAIVRRLVAASSPVEVVNPAPTLDSSWAFTRYGQLVTVSGTAVAGARIDIYFARRGQATYVPARTVTAGANGSFSAIYAASDDLTYYASNQGAKSNLVLTQLAPTVTGPQWRTVKRNTVTAVSGTGSPKTTITVHFRRSTDPVNHYPVARVVAVAANGHWSYAYTVSTDLAYYVTSNTNQIATMLYRVYYAR